LIMIMDTGKRMGILNKAGLLVLALPGLSGCSFLVGDDGLFRDRQADYLEAPIEPQMRVPETLDSYTLDQLYVVPEQVIPSEEDFARNVPRPKPLESNRPEGVVLRRYSGENWIVIAASPGQVWPRVREFWAQSGVNLDYENPIDGVMETEWMRSGPGAEGYDKFRIRIESGLHSGSSEVIVTHMARDAIPEAGSLVTWPAMSDSEDREFARLQEVSQYLADRTDIYSSSSASLLAGSLSGEQKANILDTENSQRLELRITATRAWAQVGQALERGEVEIVTRDADGFLFDVEFSGLDLEADRPGFFSRVFNDDEATSLSVPVRIQIEETDSAVHVNARVLGEVENGAQLEAELIQLIYNNIG